MKIPIDIPNVALGSVVGTTLRKSIPRTTARDGSQSTGTKSIVFIKIIQINVVKARGATIGFLPLKEPRTFSSINSIMLSTKF